MAIKAGDRLPADLKLKEMGDSGPKDVTVGEIFGGKKVVLFAVPGAFTPTCSMKHLPGFVEQAAAIRAKGVDEIVCLSVNDAFVMGAWGESSGAKGKVRMLADGNNEYPAVAGVQTENPALKALGDFKAETVPIAHVGAATAQVQQMLDRVGFK